MASELAGEIITQSRPRDRLSRVCINILDGNVEYLCVTATIINGELIVQIVFTGTSGKTLQRDAMNNLEGAARCVEEVVHNSILRSDACAK